MERAIRRWAVDDPAQIDEATLAQVIKKLSKSYTIYGSMLLLPPGSAEVTQAQDTSQHSNSTSRASLYTHIAEELKITHIAINRAIPPARDDMNDPENAIRAPLHFEPVYGDFGPASCSLPPSQQDFGQAYWVTAKQNGISQCWSPRWTMFSRGNISEKARLLQLPSIQHAVDIGRQTGRGCSAVDLYAGIGYFTFSYLKAGVSKVLCWELNDWSCEGLRKGAKINRWSIATADSSMPLDLLAAADERIILFHESNELAMQRIEALRILLPPIRHVNCGLLPSSKLSWPTAIASLDPVLGGWIHVHENFHIDDIEHRAAAIRDTCQSYLNDSARIVELESINRVKTYAPDVWHVVLDIFVPPAGD